MSADRIATERVCRTADGTYVPDGHLDAAFLVVGVGGRLPADFAGFGEGAAPAPEAPGAEDAIGTEEATPAEPDAEGAPAPEAPAKKRKPKN